MAEYVMTGNTRVGRTHTENQDCILMREIPMDDPMEAIYLLGVADGIGGTPFGGSVARWLMDKHLGIIDNIFVPQQGTLAEQLERCLMGLADRFRVEFADQEDFLESGAALSIAGVQGSDAECFWVGDVAIYVNRADDGYAGQQGSEPDWSPTRELTRYFGGPVLDLHRKRIRLDTGDVLTIASDGANLDEYVLQDMYRKHGCNNTTVSRMMDLALRSPTADDVSIVTLMRV